MRHDRDTAISDMERERPFPVNGNNDALKRQDFPLTLNETSTIQSRSILINALVVSKEGEAAETTACAKLAYNLKRMTNVLGATRLTEALHRA
jgi:hypothetical protein